MRPTRSSGLSAPRATRKLHGFRGDSGQEVFASDPLPGLRHFATILAAAGRLYVAGDGRIFAFRPRALSPRLGRIARRTQALPQRTTDRDGPNGRLSPHCSHGVYYR